MARKLKDLLADMPEARRERIKARMRQLWLEAEAMDRDIHEEDGWTVDDVGLIVNGEATYRSIQMLWLDRQPTILNWSPDPSTAHVLLLTPGPENPGDDWAHSFHPAMQSGRMMFIGVMRKGCFGFDLFDGQWVSPDYAGEKLNLQGSDAKAMADLINGMKTMIAGRPHDPPTFQEQDSQITQPGGEDSAFTVKPPV